MRGLPRLVHGEEVPDPVSAESLRAAGEVVTLLTDHATAAGGTWLAANGATWLFLPDATLKVTVAEEADPRPAGREASDARP